MVTALRIPDSSGGLRLHLVATVHGLPVGWALSGAKADERHALHDILTSTPHLTDLLAAGPRTMIADKNYYGRDFERELSDADITVLRPARKGAPTTTNHRESIS